MKTKFLRGLVAASALSLAAVVNPATAQSPVAPATASADVSRDEPVLNHAVVALAGLCVVVFLAGRRAA
jgi:hypothetical protein